MLFFSPYLKSRFTASLSAGCWDPKQKAFFRERRAARKSPRCNRTYRDIKHMTTAKKSITSSAFGSETILHVSRTLAHYSVIWYLANVVEAIALTKFVAHLACTFFAPLKAPNGEGMLPISKVDTAQVKVSTVKILWKIVLPKAKEDRS